MQEMQARSLGWEDPLEKEMATHPSIVAWKVSDGGAWWAAGHGVAKQTRLSNETTTITWTGRIDVIKMVTLRKATCRFSALPIRISVTFSTKLE